MEALFDTETLDRFRGMSPREAFEEARTTVARFGAATSEDYVEVYQALVDEGILSWEQIEAFEG